MLAGKQFETSETDASEDVHRAMVDRRLFGVDVKNSLPWGRSLQLRGYKRRWLFGRTLTSMTIATVVAPPDSLLDGRPPAPVTLTEVREHLRKLVGVRAANTPHLVGICSPGGFSPEVWNASFDDRNVKVVLIEPLSGGGWRVQSASKSLPADYVRLFDPEGGRDKLERVRREIENRRTDLLVGGLSAETLGRQLALPREVVEQSFAAACRADSELRVSRRSGDVVLYRGVDSADGKENGSMSVTDWIRSLFSREGDPARQINHLIERRNALAQRRDRIYEDVAKLEEKERALVEEGKRNTSEVARRRLAAQVAQLRKELARWNTSAAMLNQQINVISTDVHNLTLLQQGQMARLPNAEELTEHAVAAEEMLETLSADARLVEGLEAGLAQTVMTDEEAAILREFEAAPSPSRAAEPSAAPSPRAAEPPAARAPADRKEPDRPQAEG